MRLARGPARSPPERRDRRPWRQIAQYLDVGVSTGVGGSSKRGAIYKPPALDGLCSAKARGAARPVTKREKGRAVEARHAGQEPRTCGISKPSKYAPASP